MGNIFVSNKESELKNKIKDLDYYYLDYRTSLNNLNNILIEDEFKNEINQIINFMNFCKNNNLIVEVSL